MWFILTGKRTKYYKIGYGDGEYFIVKLQKGVWRIVFSVVDKQFKRLQTGNRLHGSPKSYGFFREEMSESDARIEIMLG